MVNIKTYKDGDRLVVIFEGLGEITEEKIVSTFLQSLGNVDSDVPPANVKPLPVVEDPLPTTLPEQAKEPDKEDPKPAVFDFWFVDGPYAGKTPSAILSEGTPQEQDKAFNYLSKMLKTEKSEKVVDLIKSSGVSYLKRRFASTESFAYAIKLNEKQVKTFYNLYADFCSAELISTLCSDLKKNSFDELMASDIDTLKSGVAILIEAFK